MAFQFPDPNTTTEFTGANGVVYSYDTTDGKWVVKSSPFQGDYVKRTGGDEMQGPFKVTSNPDIPASRDARRIETFGVFSGSDTTALRFGTTRDRIYVGHDDTSFNGLVKIDRIAEKNAGNSVQFENDIKMGIDNGIDLLNFARFNDNGVIFHNNNERIKFKSAGSGNDGDGLVEFPRPGSNGRRGIAIRGRDTDNDETDLLYTFTNASGGDAVNYSGRITGDTNIVTKKYVDDAVQSATPVDIKAIQAAGLQLGIFKYRRSSDSFVSGSIHSNTTTDPQNITQLDIWHTNLDGVNFGKDFYGMYIVPKMFVHIRDNGTAKYIGKITAVDLDSLSNGIRLTLSPLAALTEGSVYYNNQYDVSIGYSRYIE